MRLACRHTSSCPPSTWASAGEVSLDIVQHGTTLTFGCGQRGLALIATCSSVFDLRAHSWATAASSRLIVASSHAPCSDGMGRRRRSQNRSAASPTPPDLSSNIGAATSGVVAGGAAGNMNMQQAREWCLQQQRRRGSKTAPTDPAANGSCVGCHVRDLMCLCTDIACARHCDLRSLRDDDVAGAR
jgi:hypothetical protein